MALIWPLNRNLIWDAIGNEVLLEMKKTIICVMLTLAALGGTDEAHGLRYCTFPKGQTGVYSIGGGYYYFSYEKKAEHDGEKYFSSDVKLCRFTGEGDTLFEVIE